MIPKIIHHIWENNGPNKMPEEYVKTWKKYHPEWQHILWQDVTALPDLVCGDQLSWTKRYCKRSDILRLEILYRFGGLYTDCDFVCLKPFDEFLNVPFFAGIQPLGNSKKGIICNALMACEPGNPVIYQMLQLIKTYDKKTCASNTAVSLTGAYPLAKIWNATNATSRGVLLPQYYLYPIADRDFADNKLPHDWKQRTSRSYAIHMWGSVTGYNEVSQL